MNKKLVASLLTALLFVQATTYAATTPNSATDKTTDTASIEAVQDQMAEANEVDGKPVLKLEEAIEKGLNNSLLLQQVMNKADVAQLVKDNSYNIQNDLNKAESDLSNAEHKLNSAKQDIKQGESDLADAKKYLSEDKLPVDVTNKMLAGILPAGSPQQQQLIAGMQAGLIKPDDVAAVGDNKLEKGISIDTVASLSGLTAEEIRTVLQRTVNGAANTLESGQQEYDAGTMEYYKGQAEYQASLKYALSSVSSKLSTSTISKLEGAALGELIVKMSEKQDEVTKYAKNIYKNQVALLVEKSYFDALKEQEILKVKQKTEERGRVQYEMAKAAYEVGMKSKDDMLIAKTFYDSTIMATELQVRAYNDAMTELKKNMNVSLKEEFVLEPVEVDTTETFNLEEGIASGKDKRLEVKMAKANYDIYGYLLTAVDRSGYSNTSNQYKEVKLLQKQAEIAVESEKVSVEASIRESYQAVETTRKLVETSIDLRENAEASLELAKAKYEAGYAYSSALLSNMNLGQMAGTLVEVIASEENLANIEEKQIEAMNNYHLARLKYLNDTGVLPYK